MAIYVLYQTNIYTELALTRLRVCVCEHHHRRPVIEVKFLVGFLRVLLCVPEVNLKCRCRLSSPTFFVSLSIPMNLK